jgi:pantothenate kinase
MMADILDAVIKKGAGLDRCIVAIAGPPGAGKSTLSGDLVRQLPPGSAMALQMDGFHYDNAVLDDLGLRGRKGSPETFDFAGFAALLRRIRQLEPAIAIPVFDREADLSRAAAAIITPQVKFIIAEGNYLLLDETPWSGLAEYFDVTIFLDVPKDELRRRLLRRWIDLGDSLEKAEHWVMTNDMPNVERVLSRRRQADLVISRKADPPTSRTTSETR